MIRGLEKMPWSTSFKSSICLAYKNRRLRGDLIIEHNYFTGRKYQVVEVSL